MATLADIIATQVKYALKGALQETTPALDQAILNAAKEASQTIVDAMSPGQTGLVGLLGDIPIIGTIVKDLADPIESVLSGLGPMAQGLSLGWGLGIATEPVFRQLLEPFVQGVNEQSQNFLLDYQAAAVLAAQHILSADEARSIGGKQGYTAEQVNPLIEQATARPDTGELLALLLRGEMPEEKVRLHLNRRGFDDPTVDALLTLRRPLLSVADLALALLRGNIDQAQADSYLRMLGYTPADFEVMVGNTGEPPGTMELLEAFRRGIIGTERLDKGIRQSRVRNEWIDVVTALRYRPPSTEAAIRAYVQSYLTYEEAKAVGVKDGTDPSDFGWLAESWGDPISKTEAGELYHRGKLTRPQFVQALKESRLKDKYVDDVIELSRRLIPERTIATIVGHGVQTPAWGIQYLQELGYSHQDAATLIETHTSGRAAVHKELTQGLITEMYAARAITEQEAVTLLGELGWDPSQALFILAALDAKAALAEQRKAVTATRKAFLAHRITEPQAKADLSQLGVLDAEATTLLSDWKLELAGNVAVLSASDIANAARYAQLPWDQAVAKLVQIGYTKGDAQIFLGAHQVPLPKGVTLTEPQP